MFDNIPDELKQLEQWILWKYEGTVEGVPTKIPYDAKTNKKASSTNSSTWCTYDIARNALDNSNYSGLGFVFTDNDCYCGVDLDSTDDEQILQSQKGIYEQLASYSELSPSGKGVHIIVKAKVPAGRRRHKVEVYSSGRYFTMTGNVLQMLRPIEERQLLIDQLFNELGGSKNGNQIQHSGSNIDSSEREPDIDIIQRAMEASNGQRFSTLFYGEWRTVIDNRTGEPYASQSEADFALINMIAFYTQNRIQVERIFHQSVLGKRKKAERHEYIQWMINKAFDNIPEPIDFEAVTGAMNRAIAERLKPVPKVVETIGASNPYTVPPGLLGELAQFIYRASPRPVPEISLAAAIGFMAGMCGSAYNVSDTGLNQYILLLAQASIGKEAMASGIDKLIDALKLDCPMIESFVGPSEFSSGPALLKAFKRSRSFVSIHGEFGMRLEAMADTKANPANLSLKRVLLDLYGKSGPGRKLNPMAYSDSTKDTEVVYSPGFTLLCESTPSTFYKVVNERLIEDGLLPRFTIIDYSGKRQPLNRLHASVKLDDVLKGNLRNLASQCISNLERKNSTLVNIAPDTDQFVEDFGAFCDDQINNSNQGVVRELWGRAYLKVLKLASLVSVGCNPFMPTLTLEHATWAKAIVVHEITTLLARFERGDVGTDSVLGVDESKQVRDVARAIKTYMESDYSALKSYRVDERFHKDRLIGFSYLLQRMHNVASFSKAKINDDSKNLAKAINFLDKTEVVNLVNTKQPEFIAIYGSKEIRAQMLVVNDYAALCSIAETG